MSVCDGVARRRHVLMFPSRGKVQVRRIPLESWGHESTAFSLSFATATAATRETNPVLTQPSTPPQVLGFLVTFRSTPAAESLRSQRRPGGAPGTQAQTQQAQPSHVQVTSVDVQSLAKRSSVAF